MIKDFEEWKTYFSRLLARGITAEESAEIKKEMAEFERKNPNLFREMRESKWSCKGLKLVGPDGSVKILE